MKETLNRLYWQENKSQRQIAKELGWTQDKVKKEMRRLGIPARTLSQSQKINESNPWKHKSQDHKQNISNSMKGNKNKLGFKVSEETKLKISLAQRTTGQGWNAREYKKIAKQYLKKECSNCKTINDLCIHHRDGNHFNDDLNNLEILCRSCHIKWHREHTPENYINRES